MNGILDNPDQAYAKLREMGKGLFGKDGAGLGAALGGLMSGMQQPGGQGGMPKLPGVGQNNPLGGDLGATIGNMLQQGLSGLSQLQQGGQSQASAPRSQGRSIPAPGSDPAPVPQAQTTSPPPPAQNGPTASAQESQAMNDVLRQLFNR